MFLRSLFLLSIAAVTSLAADTDAGPRLGKYNCYAYGATGATPILIGSFVLQDGGTYTSVNKTGKYSYDAGSATVTWLSGVNKDSHYGGKFEVDRATHKIRITSRGVCMNTAK